MTIHNQPYNTEQSRKEFDRVFGKTIKCLECGNDFISQGKGYRFCSICRKKLLKAGSTIYFRPTGKRRT